MFGTRGWRKEVVCNLFFRLFQGTERGEECISKLPERSVVPHKVWLTLGLAAAGFPMPAAGKPCVCRCEVMEPGAPGRIPGRIPALRAVGPAADCLPVWCRKGLFRQTSSSVTETSKGGGEWMGLAQKAS